MARTMMVLLLLVLGAGCEDALRNGVGFANGGDGFSASSFGNDGRSNVLENGEEGKEHRCECKEEEGNEGGEESKEPGCHEPGEGLSPCEARIEEIIHHFQSEVE
ncbi:MAG: hypothetical protein KDD43_04305, partial [Bdellovibrionales bacterium]|nr:hypothetical protein [Bdellovibrionales bacterium]